MNEPCFSLDKVFDWIQPRAFDAYMASRARAHIHSRASSLSSASSPPRSRSPASSFHGSRFGSSRASLSLPRSDSDYSMYSAGPEDPIVISDDEDEEDRPRNYKSSKRSLSRVSMSSTFSVEEPRGRKAKRTRPSAIKHEASSSPVSLFSNPIPAIKKSPSPDFVIEAVLKPTQSRHKSTSKPRASQTMRTDSRPRVKKSKAKSREGIRLTTKLTVDHLNEINDVPSTWNVPRDGSAYLLDLTESEEDSSGALRSMDSIIRGINSALH